MISKAMSAGPIVVYEVRRSQAVLVGMLRREAVVWPRRRMSLYTKRVKIASILFLVAVSAGICLGALLMAFGKLVVGGR